MSCVHFISDLHLGHSRILEFSPDRKGGDVDGHSQWLVDAWNSSVKKGDVVWVLGDVCFSKAHLHYLKRMNGHKKLLIGNHDKWDWETYYGYVNEVRGFTKYKKNWLSHCPIHPTELRGEYNIHGHVHMNFLQDPNYINVSVEALDGVPITWEEIQSLIEKRKTNPEVLLKIREEIA